MSDRLEQLRSLADGVGDLQHGQPGDEGHCTAADLIRWAIAEIEKHRMTPEERHSADLCSAVCCHYDASKVLFFYLDRTAPEVKP